MPYRRMGGDQNQREAHPRRRAAPRKRRPEAEAPIAPALPPPHKRHKKQRKHTYASRPEPPPEEPGWLRALYKVVTGVVIGILLGLGMSYTIPTKKTIKVKQGVFKQQFAKQGARPRRMPPPVASGASTAGAAAGTNVAGSAQTAEPQAASKEKMRQYRYEKEAWEVIVHLERKLGLRE